MLDHLGHGRARIAARGIVADVRPPAARRPPASAPERTGSSPRALPPTPGGPLARRACCVVADRLRGVYGGPLIAPARDPLAELVLTVLSQNTNDRNRDVAFFRLRDRFADPAVRRRCSGRRCAWRPSSSRRRSARAASPGSSRRASRPSCDALAERCEDRNASLDWLATRRSPERASYLVSLPGVGRKTAACVLLFAYGLRDVRSTRTCRAWAGASACSRPAPRSSSQHDQMLALTPPGQELELHLNLLRHGRRTCHARSPRCDQCALARMCPSRRLFAAAALSRGAARRRRSPRSAARRRRARARGRSRGSRTPAATGSAARLRTRSRRPVYSSPPAASPATPEPADRARAARR